MYKFYQQWGKLRAYANEQGISIIGDIPIYVALDSADVWTHPELFLLDEENLTPLKVAGVPPDAFSETGQLWGNPLYRWDVQEKTDFAWWKERMKASARLYDVVRIDHFIGVTQYAIRRLPRTERPVSGFKGTPGSFRCHQHNSSVTRR